MKKYEEKIDKLFEAVDPEQKLTDVKDQLKQAIADEIEQQIRERYCLEDMVMETSAIDSKDEE